MYNNDTICTVIYLVQLSISSLDWFERTTQKWLTTVILPITLLLKCSKYISNVKSL